MMLRTLPCSSLLYRISKCFASSQESQWCPMWLDTTVGGRLNEESWDEPACVESRQQNARAMQQHCWCWSGEGGQQRAKASTSAACLVLSHHFLFQFDTVDRAAQYRGKWIGQKIPGPTALQVSLARMGDSCCQQKVVTAT